MPGPHRFHGGDEGIRTLGLCLAKAALSQLSYIPRRACAGAIVAICRARVNGKVRDLRKSITERGREGAEAGVTYGVAAGTRPAAPRRRHSGGFVRGRCENGPCGAKTAPQWGLRAELLPELPLWRQFDATTRVTYALAAGTHPAASKRRRSEVLPRDCGAQHREPRRNKKVAPCGYDYEPTFIRWVSSPSVPASPTTEDPLPGRNVGLPSNACRFTQFVPQGDDTSNVGEHASQHQS